MPNFLTRPELDWLAHCVIALGLMAIHAGILWLVWSLTASVEATIVWGASIGATQHYLGRERRDAEIALKRNPWSISDFWRSWKFWEWPLDPLTDFVAPAAVCAFVATAITGFLF